ncbi:MAG: SDR family NAD(P)-dependent oxidoreductase [Gordonia paraffinivorans]
MTAPSPVRPWSPDRLGDRSGQRVIVTGATNGVGFATARALARAGAHVILAVRDTERGEQRAREIGGSTEVSHLDLADLSTVRAFAERLTDPVDILVNNAGVVLVSRRDTVDGFEATIGTNFLGPFALTNLIADRVTDAVVIVGSDAHRMTSLRLDDLDLRSGWNAQRAYAQSKLADMLWGLELDRRYREAGSSVSVTLTHPGWVRSNLSSVGDGPIATIGHAVVSTVGRVFANDIDAGAAPTLFALTEPLPSGSFVGVEGRFGLKGAPALSGRTAEASNHELASALWDIAERRTNTHWPL